jgi:DNA modification methylase
MLSNLHGDCRQILPTLPEQSVHCCICSPPYWGLRDYGTGRWQGGSPDCVHDTGGKRQIPQSKWSSTFVSIASGGNRGAGRDCIRCGAVRLDAQIGLEPTPEEYVENLVQVFREVRRVLRDNGSLWLNLGDSYTSGGRKSRDPGRSTMHAAAIAGVPRPVTPERLRAKELVGIPWRVAFALQADGWLLRTEVIWHKPNACPESVRDRPTRCHEYLFLFAKQPHYYYDAAAIREPWAKATTLKHARSGYRRIFTNQGHGLRRGQALTRRQTWAPIHSPGFRNKRSVWTVATQAYHGAHFAAFPPELIRPCVRAGCPTGGTILDPFAGAGTTGLVAEQEGRNAILIELNAAYIELQRERLLENAG